MIAFTETNGCTGAYVSASFHGKGSTMQHCVTLIQHHLARLHGDVVGLASVVVHFDRPWFVDVLGHLDDAR